MFAKRMFTHWRASIQQRCGFIIVSSLQVAEKKKGKLRETEFCEKPEPHLDTFLSVTHPPTPSVCLFSFLGAAQCVRPAPRLTKKKKKGKQKTKTALPGAFE